MWIFKKNCTRSTSPDYASAHLSQRRCSGEVNDVKDMYQRVHRFRVRQLTTEPRVETATNVTDDIAKYREMQS